MGATVFTNTGVAPTAREAFQRLQDEARYEYGHRGYTGTIAEKDSFMMIACPVGHSAIDYANELIDKDDPRIDDKWGPAGCIDLGPLPDDPHNHKFLFFGWASE